MTETAKRSRYEEYLICQERGHRFTLDDDIEALLDEREKWQKCKFCGTQLRRKTGFDERDVPTPE